MDWSVFSKVVDANKLGGWVRAGVASILSYLIAHYAAKWPLLTDILNPQIQAGLGIAAATIVVGWWSQLTKTDTAKLSMAAAIPGPAKEAAFAGIPDSAKIAAVTALPDVEKVVVQAKATDGVGAALADPAQTKVVSQ